MASEKLTIRPFQPEDWAAVWQIIGPVFKAGDTYALPTNIGAKQAYQVWIAAPSTTYVAVGEKCDILGTYYIKPNQLGPGDHVCNCGYIVGEHARGRGIASQLCIHSQREARAQGYRAMQYNLVVSTNEGAVSLWKNHGFDIVGTLPGAFRHPHEGFVDAFVMYKSLET